MNKLINRLSKFLLVNSSRRHLEILIDKAASSVAAHSWVLDAGAGDCPYKSKFHHTNYETADFCQLNKQYGVINHICDLTNLPMEDNKYDLILMTQVLEHLAEPTKVLGEIYRVLKPGGSLWLSAPFYIEEHEIPYDFFRYTQFGLKFLITSVGFEIKEMDWLEGFYGTLSHQLRIAARHLPLHVNNYGGGIVGMFTVSLVIILKPFFLLLNIIFSRLDIRYKYTRGGQCKNYYVIATKENQVSFHDTAK